MKDFIYKTLMDSYRSIIRINTQTRAVYISKFLNLIWSSPDIPMSLSDLFSFAFRKVTVLPEDMWMFDLLKTSAGLTSLFREKNPNGMLIYRQLEENDQKWIRMNFVIPENFSEENPDVLFLTYEMNPDEVHFYDSYASLAKRYHKIMQVNLTENTYVSIREYPAEKLQHERFPTNSYTSEKHYIAKKLVHPEDAEAFLRQLTTEAIRKHFAMGNSEFTYFFRRRIGPLYRWVQLIIVPSAEYKPDYEVFHFFVEDVHKSMLRILDTNAATVYNSFFTQNGGNVGEIPMSYYENLLSVLHTFTGKFVDYYMVDLERDLYIQYRLQSGVLHEAIPFVGNYSAISQEYIRNTASDPEKKILEAFCTSDKLREQMMDRMTLEYEFTTDQGIRMKTVCRKHESLNGIPTKVICYTMKCNDALHLLKIKTFGNFQVLMPDGTPLHFARKQSRHLLAYLIDKHGYPVTSKDIAIDLLEKAPDDLNAIKYVSTLIHAAINDLEKAGYPEVIIKDARTVRINVDAVDCDYYHVLDGDHLYWQEYHNEYMKEYSWAEATNAELLLFAER